MLEIYPPNLEKKELKLHYDRPIENRKSLTPKNKFMPLSSFLSSFSRIDYCCCRNN